MSFSDIRRNKITGILVDAINRDDIRKTRQCIYSGADLNLTLNELEILPGLRESIGKYELVNLGRKCWPRSILACALLRESSAFVEAILAHAGGTLDLTVFDKLLALEHCSIDVFRILVLEYGTDLTLDDLEWRRWRKRDFAGNLLIGTFEKETVSINPLNAIIKTLGHSSCINPFEENTRLMQQVEKLKLVYMHGNYGNSLIVTLVNRGYRYAVENLLSWGVLDCGGRWEEIISLCIQNRLSLMLKGILENDKSIIPSSITAHLNVLRDDWMFMYLGANKIERVVRLLINSNFPFYGHVYDANYDDTITKLMLLHFAGVEVTDYSNVTRTSLTYVCSLNREMLKKLPIEFESVCAASKFMQSQMRKHEPKRLAFLCKLHIRKYLGPCQTQNILEMRMIRLPLPKILIQFLTSSLI